MDSKNVSRLFRYPWESAYSGVEVVPDCCPEIGENEQHITGDISFALRLYLAATRDLVWLKETIITAAADTGTDPLQFAVNMAGFWASRPTFNGETQKWDISGIVLFLYFFSTSS